MTNRYSRPIFVAILLGLTVFGCKYFQPTKSKQDATKTSDAYEALNFFGSARIYPFDKMPPAGYMQAWRYLNQMAPAETATRSTDPWITLGPHNRAGRTLKLAFNPQNPNTMYAGSASGGLWRSYTGGMGTTAWHRVPTGFPVPAVGTIAFPPNDSMTIFIGTGEVYNHQTAGTGSAYRNTRGTYGIGLLRSKDGGQSWTKSLDFSQDQNKGVWDVEVAPSNAAIVYAATSDGVYKSINGGDSWTLVHNVVLANDLVIHPTNPDIVVVGCGNQSSPGYGIYRTSNGGANWTKITAGLPDIFNGKIMLDRAPSAPDVIYASIGNGLSSAEGASWLCRSSDFGTTWSVQTTTDYSQWQGWYSHDVAVSPTNPNELVIVGIDTWRSSNGGQTIVQKSQSTNGGIGFTNAPIGGPDGGPEFVHSDIHDAIWHPTLPGVFYVADDGGVHRSTDNGESFQSASGRMQTAQFYNGFSNSATDEFFCMGGLQDNGSIRLNPDIDPVTGSTVTWRRKFGGDGSWSAINQQDDQYSYLSWQNLNMLGSDDGGNSYNYLSPPVQGPVAFVAPFALAPSNGQVIYAGSAIVAKSTDGGDNWTTTNNGQPLDGNPMLSIAISNSNPNVAYVASAPLNGNPGHIFVTQTGGNTWANVSAGLPNRFILDLEVDPTNDAVAFAAIGGYGSGHLFRTSDYGASWEDISNGLPDLPTSAIAIDPLFPNNLYVGNDLGVFSSVDFGATWQSYLDGLPEAVMVFDLKISPANRKLRAATHGSGVYQRALLEMPYVSAGKEALVENMDLELFPNPTTSKASLSYQLPDKQLVTVEILGNSGRLFKTVLWETQLPGKHTVGLPLGELSAGIHYVRLKVGQSFTVQKLMVNK
ncbi:MAG: T9SS type A sorting domain-containing protein [Saprospiraceae bacterium]|nr:T9SS type A sorting domain-containing protein [Saprospiraceae bacterium]MCF8249206.1 T9SS type A sorting domain-containing protein [Saprospiraceae bacterium]MCF8280187.1 T9SS type A sorting domain-containing protein [Bacteroidales bacterium]MCF8311335.1 T9SS type A sorting domain-containing protein [Saprospiraceae bacterium]MCF8440101.1 T9SS type A sorting domain-containing protein [Saprospiraceae bacterium]